MIKILFLFLFFFISQNIQNIFAQENSLLLQANAFSAEGELDKASDLYRKALAEGGNKAIIYYNLGNIYYRKNNFSDAAKSYREVISQAPLFKNAYHNLGKLYYQLGEYSEALRVFRTFHLIKKDDYDTLILMGDTSREMQDHFNAMRYYEKAKNLETSRADAYLALADLFLSLSDGGSALEILRKGEEVLTNPRPLMRFRAQILYDEGRYRDAANVLSLLLLNLKTNLDKEKEASKRERIQSDYYSLTVRLADALSQEGLNYLAIYELKKIVSEYPKQKQGLRLLESLLLREKKEEEAFDFFKDFFDEDPKEYYRIMRNLLIRAYNNEKKGLSEKMLAFYKEKEISDEISRLLQ